MGIRRRNIKLWRKLQQNGEIAYRLAPEASCSIAGRTDVEAWGEFVKQTLGQRVLDIGCGPYLGPPYLNGTRISYIGIDPLLPYQRCDTAFAQAVGEYLPFRDATFDTVIIAGSLDHVLSESDVLSEAHRCLVDSGHLLIWYSLIDRESLMKRIKKKIHPPTRSTAEKPRWLQITEALPVPRGAVDKYHRAYTDDVRLQHNLQHLGFTVCRKERHNTHHVFLDVWERCVEEGTCEKARTAR